MDGNEDGDAAFMMENLSRVHLHYRRHLLTYSWKTAFVFKQIERIRSEVNSKASMEQRYNVAAALAVEEDLMCFNIPLNSLLLLNAE